jgi:acetylornithine deacetylase
MWAAAGARGRRYCSSERSEKDCKAMFDDAACERLLAVIEELRPRIIEVLGEAVRIPSVNPEYPGQAYAQHVGKETAVAKLVASVYEQAGARVDVFAVEEGRDNAVGVLGRGVGRSLLMNGHIDVVPAGRRELWKGDPFSGEVADGRVWGRGSTDMKAGVIAQAFAALAVARAGITLDGQLILTAVVGEETGDHRRGITAVIERGYRADAAIVGEPSAPPFPLAIVPITPGLLWFGVRVEGKATHDGLRGATIHPTRAGSRLGVNAIDKGFLIYEGLRALEDEWAECRRHPLFEPGHWGINPGLVHGATVGVDVPFFLADEMRFEYCAVFHPDHTTDQVKSEIAERIHAVAQLDPWLREHQPAVEWKLEWPPWRAEPDHPIIPALERAHERAAVGTPFEGTPPHQGYYGVCDATWLAAAGIPSIVYGPGDIAVAHAANESVDIEELITSCKTFALLAASWCTAD